VTGRNILVVRRLRLVRCRLSTIKILSTRAALLGDAISGRGSSSCSTQTASRRQRGRQSTTQSEDGLQWSTAERSRTTLWITEVLVNSWARRTCLATQPYWNTGEPGASKSLTSFRRGKVFHGKWLPKDCSFHTLYLEYDCDLRDVDVVSRACRKW